MLWCIFLYTAFPLSPEVQQDWRKDSYDCFQFRRKQLLYLLGGSERHWATWRAPLAPGFKSLGCVCSFVCLSGLHGTAWPSCSALMPVGDRLDIKHNTEKDDKHLLYLYRKLHRKNILRDVLSPYIEANRSSNKNPMNFISHYPHHPLFWL